MEPLTENLLEDARTEALKRTVIAQFSRVIDIAPYLGAELHEVLAGINEAGKLADFIAANLDLALPAKAELLAIDDVTRRLERLGEFLMQELQVLEVGTQIQEKVKTRLDQNQREYVLREQLQVIRQELGKARATTSSKSWAGGSTRPSSRRKGKKWPTASSNACARCRRSRPSIRSRAPISTSSPRCPGAASRRTGSTSRPRARSSIATITISRPSRNASSSTSRCGR